MGDFPHLMKMDSLALLVETVSNQWVNGKSYSGTEILQSLRSFRMTANELVILSEAKNLDTAPTHQIGTDSFSF